MKLLSKSYDIMINDDTLINRQMMRSTDNGNVVRTATPLYDVLDTQ